MGKAETLGIEGFSLSEELLIMDSPAAPSPGSGDDRFSRAKFLCSFGGSILPRPLDGKLRYVGGETRIITVPHDVSYDDLLSRTREIFEHTSVIKYKQPEEDLDALVSVVNDDDVMNMMEEYEKLTATGDGFTRLRIFLFSQFPESDEDMAAAAHFDADEREAERRYVDALNNLTDANSQSQQNYGEADSMIWLPPGAVIQEKSGFPIHLGYHQTAAAYDGEHSHVVYKRGQTPMPNSWFPDSRFVSNAFPECYHGNFFVQGNFYEGNEVYQAQQTDRAIPHVLSDGFGNHANVYGEDSFYQFQHNLPPLHLRRKAQVPLGLGAAYELPGLVMPNGAMSAGPPLHGYQDRSPKPPSGVGMDVNDRNQWAARNGHFSQKPADAVSEKVQFMTNGNQFAPSFVLNDCAVEAPEKNGALAKFDEKSFETNKVSGYDAKADIRVESLELLPELIASAEKVVTVENEEPLLNENVHAEGELESDGDDENKSFSRIEPTTAETEALAKGLQTIQSDDLEEIKELGSGTYGAVYHSKWRGSDVAVKRIKASCFTGKPAERERLIADFWKEALILSSLHHPNVVSFYGVVRDGPDGSLATVTEFMVNGSLKQFLHKKDRTIDRRKRLIIAMDVAFGMEYLHGKNIVHFDLKCENLLVNMRDPHRPICKIGDLGLSKVKQHTLVSGGVRGTLPWMAPELFSGKTSMVSEKIDVYSFGIVMWELLTGEEPYSNRHCASIIGGIVNSTLRPEIPSWCDPEWKSLMESCWSTDPTQRPSFSEISQRLRKVAAAANVK